MLKFNYPIGFEQFHTDAIVTFQLNRWHSSGTAELEDIREICGKIKDFTSWKQEFTKLAEKVLDEGRVLNAATYYRAAEFFALPSDRDKMYLYDKCIELYRLAYSNEPIEWFEIPYAAGALTAFRVKAEQEKGIIVLHGGYDSFIHEFYPCAAYFVEKGYTVYAFEGPGQGAPLHKHNIKMTHEWEKPVKSVLDYFRLDGVILVGVSLGGYLAARAAAFEPRIKGVVLFDIIYDFYGAMMSKKPPVARFITNAMMKLKMKSRLNLMESKIRKSSLFADWLLGHGYYVYGVDNIYDYLRCIKSYSTVKISSKINQHVLLMAGEEDIYTIYFDKQKSALINARSVEGKIFTKEEHASHHCQVGNLKLAMDYIIEWIAKIL